MATDGTEQLRILRMIEQGHITAEDGTRLLEALRSGDERRAQAESPQPSGRARWFRVRVTDLATGKHKVNINIPVTLVNVGLKMGARFAPDMEGLNLDQISDMVRAGATGKLIEIEDPEDGERVEIFVE